MNWLCILLLIGGGVVGYIAGIARASIAAQREIAELHDRIDTQMIGKRYGGMLHFHQPTGPRPPLAEDEDAR
jgi:hypothetical protein